MRKYRDIIVVFLALTFDILPEIEKLMAKSIRIRIANAVS